MATIEERAKAWNAESARHHFTDLDDWQSGYVQGANEQEQIDIDRICQWLETHLPYYCDKFDESYTAEVISDLRYEMAKEE